MNFAVGADANADGNLDFDEFVSMVKHVRTNRPRREMLKMYVATVCVCVCVRARAYIFCVSFFERYQFLSVERRATLTLRIAIIAPS